jgi:hypothetical protein
MWFIFITLFLSQSPQPGDWSCWAAHNSLPCSVAYISKSKEEATIKAIEACEEFCGRFCSLDYCEQLKK